MSKPFLSLLTIFIAVTTGRQVPDLTVSAQRGQVHGWMRDGWGSYKLTIANNGDQAATLVSWSAHWEAGGRAIGDSWGGQIDQPLPPHAKVVRDEIGSLPANVIDAAKPRAPSIVGSFTVKRAFGQTIVPFAVKVPEAILPEPLKLIKGKTAGIELMRSRFRTFKHSATALRWVDECYQAMIDLTGRHPFGGKLMVFKESPPHPYWAYAGQEMILNTDYVPQTIKDFDNGILAFGWVHEVGHNFDDGIGDWYIWNGPSAEFQANFKLSYAISSIPDQSFRMKWRNGAPAYGAKSSDVLMTGPELVQKFFMLFGDGYLAQPKRSWDTLSSDEMQSLFQRLEVVYGWSPFKKWYRTYQRLADLHLQPPTTPEGKVNLIAAILSNETSSNLIPVFQMWRFPVTQAKVDEMRLKYLNQ